MKIQQALPLGQVRIDDPFWTEVRALVTETVIPYQEAILNDRLPAAEKSHAVENFRLAAGEAEGEFYGMVFQDSDVAKWLEAVAYSLSFKPDPELEKRADRLIELIGRAQGEDGYLNTYFTVKEPEHRWQNLLECHELYCAGHLIEAACAYYEATGKTRFLEIMRKNADLICARFGRGEGQQRGWPGHQEIELALLRLYRVTGVRRYLETARYFLDDRGTEPDYFEEELASRSWYHFGNHPLNKHYAQSHAPVREQKTADGHSVRAAYMYAAMADLASETDDRELFEACERLWENIAEKRMYVTGGIGSSRFGEAFTADYHLPNDTIYAETCASVAMVFFCRRMLENNVRGKYADLMEKELFNGVLSGMQLDGKRFFYVNPLEVVPGLAGVFEEYKHVLPERPGWYACACCPPNVARLMASLEKYAWGVGDRTVYAHLFMGSEVCFESLGGLRIRAESAFPEEGRLSYEFEPGEGEGEFCFAIRKPHYVESWSWRLNGERLSAPETKEGYAYLKRRWTAGDRLEISFELEPRRIYCNVKVRNNNAQIALARGPLVYALESKDNGENLAALRLPREAALRAVKKDGFIWLEAEGFRMVSSEKLYDSKPPVKVPQTIRALPYYAWGNRGPGEMRVWIYE